MELICLVDDWTTGGAAMADCTTGWASNDRLIDCVIAFTKGVGVALGVGVAIEVIVELAVAAGVGATVGAGVGVGARFAVTVEVTVGGAAIVLITE